MAQRKNFLPWLAILLTLLLVGAAVYFQRPDLPPAPVTFSYRDHILEELPGVPLNRYDHALFLQTGDRITYPGAKEGIDVSVHQKEIDWEAVAGDGIQFAILRIGYRGYTQGGLNLDRRFEENFQGALEAGLEVGVYFFSQATTPQEAEAEADFLLSALDNRALTYPVVFDWEFITPGEGARTDGLDGDTLTQCALAFCRRVAEGGYSPMVYFNQDLAYLTLDLSQLAQYPFWLAEYDSAPDFHYGFTLWQYTNEGTVAGIEGPVDRNLDFGPLLAQ